MARELPILMHGESVRGILAGRKWQTRRPVKPWLVRNGEHTDVRDAAHLCPYGQPGDLLWVRETHRLIECDCRAAGYSPMRCQYCHGCGERAFYRADSDDRLRGWLPSIHMPKRIARIWLRVTSVRVERVQDISTEDIIAEGLSTTLREHDAVCALHEQWQHAWDAMHRNKSGLSWKSNPYVWAISFEVAEVRS